MVPLATAAHLNLPVVDADGMGRAFPEVYMETFHIYGLSGTPACVVNEWGDVVTFRAHTNQTLEHYARAVTIRMGGHAFLSHFAMQGTDLKRTAVRGTLGFAKRLGEAVLRVEKTHRDPIAALLKAARTPPYGGADIIFVGKIVDVQRRTSGGFARGRVLIDGTDDYFTRRMRIEFQNENLVAVMDERPVVTVPDLITVLDRENGTPITTEYLHYGQRVTVLAIAAPPIMKSPEALLVWGPEAFGYSYPYLEPHFIRANNPEIEGR